MVCFVLSCQLQTTECNAVVPKASSSPSIKSESPSTIAPEEEEEEEEEESNPDILVFGFQELDLSAEALLYSTSTAKEDAWTQALLAAMGENAVLYEKVRELVCSILDRTIDFAT
jgi:phosphatidylinositol-bisphosphatase